MLFYSTTQINHFALVNSTGALQLMSKLQLQSMITHFISLDVLIFAVMLAGRSAPRRAPRAAPVRNPPQPGIYVVPLH